MENEKKKDLKFIFVFIIILSLSIGYLFQATYAKYRKQIIGNTDFSIAKWNIKINNEDIKNKKELENSIVPIFDENEYVKEGVIAPGTTGYCDIYINGENVDVTFEYELTPSIPDESTIKDLKITEYIVNPDDANSTKVTYTEGSSIKGTIEHNIETTQIRLFLTWDDSATNIMDNAADTAAAADEESKAIIKTTLKFSQVNA